MVLMYRKRFEHDGNDLKKYKSIKMLTDKVIFNNSLEEETFLKIDGYLKGTTINDGKYSAFVIGVAQKFDKPLLISGGLSELDLNEGESFLRMLSDEKARVVCYGELKTNQAKTHFLSLDAICSVGYANVFLR